MIRKRDMPWAKVEQHFFGTDFMDYTDLIIAIESGDPDSMAHISNQVHPRIVPILRFARLF